MYTSRRCYMGTLQNGQNTSISITVTRCGHLAHVSFAVEIEGREKQNGIISIRVREQKENMGVSLRSVRNFLSESLGENPSEISWSRIM